MPTVFAIHEPTRWDHAQRRTVAIDLSPAREHGDLRVIFPGLGKPPPTGEWFIESLTAALLNFKQGDFLLIAGNMEHVAWATVVVFKITGALPSFLKWDNRAGRYELIRSPNMETLKKIVA